jgi:hypothetical protein
MRVNWNGGADRNRTCDLLIANETLYQLSYDPIPSAVRHAKFLHRMTRCAREIRLTGSRAQATSLHKFGVDGASTISYASRQFHGRVSKRVRGL